MGRLALAMADIKLAHSVFALPFAVLAAFLAAPATRADAPPGAWRTFAAQLGLVVLCMVFARTWAMLVNRVADRRFDAANPRTARRAVASGRLRARDAGVIALASAGAFVGCCAGFLAFGNAWPLILSVPTLAWIALYSYTKRFTALAHLFLGGALAASPVAAAIAVDPGTIGLTGTLAPSGGATLLLAGFVLLWVAGFDVAYALQDLDFDRRTGLRSIPAALGWRGALWAARGMHLLALGALVGANLPDARLGALFGAATALVAGLLVAEHAVLARRGLDGLPMAFFTLNGAASLALGTAGVVDVVV